MKIRIKLRPSNKKPVDAGIKRIKSALRLPPKPQILETLIETSKIRIFPPLYTRNSRGGIQIWKIEVEGNKWRTRFGQIDGKIQTGEWTTCEGKNLGRSNATTPEQQAMLEAANAHRRRIEHGAHLDVNQIDKPKFFTPMLAHSYKDHPDITYPIWSQPKLDGIRCLVNSEGMLSRRGKPIVAAPHIFAACQELGLPSSITLDGELYADKFKSDFDSLCSIIRKMKPTKDDLDRSELEMEYWIYDMFDSSRPDLPFEVRFAELDLRIFKSQPGPSFKRRGPLVRVPTHLVKDKTKLDDHYETYLSMDLEGQMIRDPQAKYKPGRGKALLKRKELLEEEFPIIGVEAGKGKCAREAARLIVRLPNGKIAKPKPMGGTEFAQRLLRDRNKVIGKLATVRFGNYTPDGSLRFPRAKAIRDYE
jgi:DNA ligase-1